MKGIATALALFVCYVYAKHHKQAKGYGIGKDQLKMLLSETEKRGLFLASFIGDNYVGVDGDQKLVAKDKKEDANLFNIDLKSENYDLSEGLLLQPWIKDKKYVITYNSVGDAINVEIPIKVGYKSKSDATILTEVIGHNADHPVYIIRSKYRNLCVTLDPSIKEYYLKPCSNGGNDMQTFRFLTYDEAEKIEARKSGTSAFDIKTFLASTKVPSSTIVVSDKNGVVYNPRS